MEAGCLGERSPHATQRDERFIHWWFLDFSSLALLGSHHSHFSLQKWGVFSWNGDRRWFCFLNAWKSFSAISQYNELFFFLFQVRIQPIHNLIPTVVTIESPITFHLVLAHKHLIIELKTLCQRKRTLIHTITRKNFQFRNCYQGWHVSQRTPGVFLLTSCQTSQPEGLIHPLLSGLLHRGPS